MTNVVVLIAIEVPVCELLVKDDVPKMLDIGRFTWRLRDPGARC